MWILLFFLGRLFYKYKIVIVGNYDIIFDEEMLQIDINLRRFGLDVEKVKLDLIFKGVSSVKDFLINCVYLEDVGVELYGIKIYGFLW